MSIFGDLQEKRRQRKTLLDDAGKILTEFASRNRPITGEALDRWERMHREGQRILEKEIQPLEARVYGTGEFDNRMSGREETRGGDSVPPCGYGDGGDGGMPETDPNETRIFRSWMRHGDQALSDADRNIIAENRQRRIEQQVRGLSGEQRQAEMRALAAGIGASGGYSVPQSFEYKMDVALRSYGGLFSTSEIIPTTDGRLLPYPSINDSQNQGESLSENQAVGGSGIAGAAAEVDPTFAVVNFGAWMKSSGIVLMPVQLIEDSAFDVEKLLIDLLKVRIGRLLSNLMTTSGAGGSTDVTPILTAATLGTTTTTSVTISYNNLIDLIHSVDPAYRTETPDNGAGFMFADSTLQAVKKLVDSNQRPLFIAGGVSEGIQSDSPGRLCGFRYTVNQQMPSINAAAKPILFGALRKFKIRRVREVQLVRFGERYMSQLCIGYLAFLRVDSNIVDAGNHPIRYLQIPKRRLR